MDVTTVDHSPAWVDAVVGIAPVELMDTRELALMAVHPDGCVTSWSPQDPSALLMRKRQLNAMCVASVYDVARYSSLIWFGGPNGVQCYRARRRDGRYVHLQFLYHLLLEGITGIRELQTNGDSLIGMTNSVPPQIVLWNSIGHIANAENVKEQADKCVSKYVCGHNETMFLSQSDEVSSFLIHDKTVWLGYSNGVILVLDTKGTKWDTKTSCIFRTAGVCAVTVLTLLKCSLEASFVVSGLENGDIILWTLKGAIHTAQYFKHTSAICAMTSVPWINGLCTLSCTREVFFWKWQCGSGGLEIIEQYELDDNMGQSTPHCICAVRDNEIIACGAEKSHILHCKIVTKPCEMVNIPLTPPSSITNYTEAFSQQLQELRNECRQWQNLYSASEAERQSAEHNAFTSQADAAELRRQIRRLEEKVSKWYNEPYVDARWEQEVMEKNFQIEDLTRQLEAAYAERDEALKSIIGLEKEINHIRKIQKEEDEELTSPKAERCRLEEKEKEEGCGTALKLKSMGQGERRHVERVVEMDEVVNTRFENVNNTHTFLRLDKGVQVSSDISNQHDEKVKEKEEETMKKKKEKSREKEGNKINITDSSITRSNTTTNKKTRHFVHESIKDSKVAEPILKAFIGEATPQSCSSSSSSSASSTSSSALLPHYHTGHQKYQNHSMLMNNSIVSAPMITHTHEGDRNDLAKLLKGEDTVTSCITKTLRVQLALMEKLLQNHRRASASSDHLPIYSTNILTDVYFMTRDILGIDEASAITQEALEGWPLVNEREVVCKLFYTICRRYQTTFFQSSSQIEKRSR
ncbi:hypothetical protein LSM04_009565 [Trypanosoma melophagium]|uniref:uncharacterized protein n=1 Tax=Trypanosoma melophagium TaxID=715481 RepID=UPI00351A94C6|nr:hypothetical protein LSM04_009565 [Trypanosoma melophagium]